MDWKNFKISHDRYFNGDEEHSAEEYEKIMLDVIQEISNDGGYYLADDGENYEVKPLSEMPLPEPTEEEKIQNRIFELKQKLAETDYVVIKIAEGESTAEEYAEVLANRKAWRAEINELESKLNKTV